MTKTDPKIALVLSGGGARGAYEAGILSQIRKSIWTDRHGFSIHCGSSAGAINTCFMAATADDPKLQGANIRSLWEGLRSCDIYKGDLSALTRLIARSVTYTTSHLFGFAPLIQKMTGKIQPFQGLLDTAPFIPFLKKAIPFKKISQNIHNGPVDAITIGATNVGNGKLELFMEKKESTPYHGPYRIHLGPIDWLHAIASAAVPVIFPPVRIGPYFYVDGSIRQNTPMSPAVQLGAGKILILGVKHKTIKETSGRFQFAEPNAYPSFTHLAGKLMDALFLDHIDYDLEQMTRINQIIEWGEKIYGADFLNAINAHVRKEGLEGDIASRGLRKIDAFPIFPSEDIGRIACERLLQLSRTRGKLTQVDRFFLRFLEVDPNADLDLLSYLMFEKEYLGALIEMGMADCKRRETELTQFLT